MLEIYKKVLTDFGSQCQAQALSGKKITFTVFQLGDGEYTGEETVETLMAMNALKSTKQEFGISKMELSEDSDTIILTLIAINSEVNIGYNIREIGIFAKDANGAQGLYSICVAKKDKPDWMPAYNGIDPVTLVYRDYLRVGNVENISVDLNSGGLATEKMLEETATELRSEIETLEFEDYTGEGAAVPETREAIAAIVSGIKRPTLISKIKAALMGLVTLGEMRALLVNNGLCTEPGKYFMDAAFGKMLQDQISDVNSNLAAVSEDDTDAIAWVKEKYNAMPNQSVRIIYNHYSAEALYIFCKNTSAWGVVYRNLRSSDNTVFQKLRVSSGTWDANWVEPQYWALGEYGVTDIPKNADMHTYLTPGNYRMGSNTNATTLKNCPLSKAFTMKVYYGTGHPTDPEGYGYIIQDYLAFDGSREVRCNYHVFNNDWITYEVGITKI